jgi:hypothetical protein
MSPGEAAIREAEHADANPPPVATPFPVAALRMITSSCVGLGYADRSRDALSAFCGS